MPLTCNIYLYKVFQFSVISLSFLVIASCSKSIDIKALDVTKGVTNKPQNQSLPMPLDRVNSWNVVELHIDESDWRHIGTDEPYLKLALTDCKGVELSISELYVDQKSLSANPSIAQESKMPKGQNHIIRAYYDSSLFDVGAKCVQIRGGTMLGVRYYSRMLKLPISGDARRG
jgi:hypothetical protein